VLIINGHDVEAYKRSMLMMFMCGGGKARNHFYVGKANSGKTALTRPVMALFGDECFVKPQVGTSFALAGLVGSRAVSDID